MCSAGALGLMYAAVTPLHLDPLLQLGLPGPRLDAAQHLLLELGLLLATAAVLGGSLQALSPR